MLFNVAFICTDYLVCKLNMVLQLTVNTVSSAPHPSGSTSTNEFWTCGKCWLILIEVALSLKYKAAGTIRVMCWKFTITRHGAYEWRLVISVLITFEIKYRWTLLTNASTLKLCSLCSTLLLSLSEAHFRLSRPQKHWDIFCLSSHSLNDTSSLIKQGAPADLNQCVSY